MAVYFVSEPTRAASSLLGDCRISFGSSGQVPGDSRVLWVRLYFCRSQRGPFISYTTLSRYLHCLKQRRGFPNSRAGDGQVNFLKMMSSCARDRGVKKSLERVLMLDAGEYSIG